MRPSKKLTKSQVWRDANAIANRRLSTPDPSRLDALWGSLSTPTPTDPLPEIEDRRLWRPSPSLAPARTLNTTRARIVIRQVEHLARHPPRHLQFEAPRKVLICIRRQRRREVLFASRKTGSGRKHKQPHRNQWSSISCKD